MRPTAFSNPGQFWRGNIHTHSTLSDGALEPAEVCRRYQAEGYDFIALTDHFIGLYDYPMADTRPFRNENFTTIIGAELHSGAMENGELWHILAVGLPDDFAPPNSPFFIPNDDQESGAEIARRARDAGAFVAIAHPEWSGLSEADAWSIDAAHAVEVYNHGCAVECDRPHGFMTLDRLNSKGRRMNLIATDDAHFKGPDHFGGWVMVKAEANEPSALVTELREGAYYATTGPDIHEFRIEDGTAIVECSPAEHIIAVGYGAAASVEHGDGITRAELPLTRRFETSDWVRIAVQDAAGKRAWSNPIWL